MSWKKEFFQGASSLLLLIIALSVGIYSAGYFLGVVERRNTAADRAFDSLHVDQSRIVPGENKIEALFKNDLTSALGLLLESLWGILPAIALFLFVYGIVARLSKKISSP